MSDNYSNGGGRRLIRPRDGRLVAGVCAAIAAYFNIDTTIVRLAFGVLTFVWGLGALLYFLSWAIIPEEGEDQSIVETVINKAKSR
ncbi:MAG TPA: PspC domain-containing protein [Streptosporangiaceae bacterium]|nr:PspC domain-containing protein [Streptosporangiaceae bacterium]